jgi:hypothetical protein
MHVIQTVIVPGAKKKYSESDVKAAVGRISEGVWSVYKVSKEYKVQLTTLRRKGC